MSTDMTQFAALRWLAKWSVRSFLSRSFPSRSSRFGFAAEACATSYLCRAVPLAGGVQDSPHHLCSLAEAGLILHSGLCSVKYSFFLLSWLS